MRIDTWDEVQELRIPDGNRGMDVLSNINIIDLISPHVILKPQMNGEHRGLCPFHSEKTPSFFVNEEKGVYLCRGCNESGNAFTWLVKHDGMSKAQALRHLLVMAGMDELSASDVVGRQSHVAVESVESSADRRDGSKEPDAIMWDVSDVCGRIMQSNVDDDEMIGRMERILRMLDDLYLAGDRAGLIALHKNYPRMLHGDFTERPADEDVEAQDRDIFMPWLRAEGGV